jgi:hypothetical protein
MIVAGGGENFVAAAQHVLPHHLRRHVRIASLGEIAVGGAANESALALRVEPARCFTIGNDGGDRCALTATLLLLLLLLLVSAWAVLRTTALSATSALIAAATAVVTIIALARLSTLMLLIAAATTTGALRIVGLLL